MKRVMLVLVAGLVFVVVTGVQAKTTDLQNGCVLVETDGGGDVATNSINYLSVRKGAKTLLAKQYLFMLEAYVVIDFDKKLPGKEFVLCKRDREAPDIDWANQQADYMGCEECRKYFNLFAFGLSRNGTYQQIAEGYTRRPMWLDGLYKSANKGRASSGIAWSSRPTFKEDASVLFKRSYPQVKVVSVRDMVDMVKCYYLARYFQFEVQNARYDGWGVVSFWRNFPYSTKFGRGDINVNYPVTTNEME